MSDSVTPWTVAHQAPLSMGFFGQEYWSGLLQRSGVVLFSRGPSQPRDRTWVSCIAGGFFAIWATKGSELVGVHMRGNSGDFHLLSLGISYPGRSSPSSVSKAPDVKVSAHRQ